MKPASRVVLSRFVGTSRASSVLVAVIVCSTFARLYLAAKSGGSSDVAYWSEFAQGVREHGPIGIYGHEFDIQYNHAPLAGWFLKLVNAGIDVGLPFAYLIRVPSSLMDGVTCWLIYRLLSEHLSTREAWAATAAVAWSPVLIVISGFHGNTDTVFVALVLVSYYLLTRRSRPFVAGVCIALAISLKLVPVVALPWLLYLAWRAGWAAWGRFVLGGMLVVVVLWLPVIVLAWPEFRDNVLGYQGMPFGQWGVAELLQGAGYPGGDAWLAAHATWAAFVAAALPFSTLLSRRRRQDTVGIALALVSMLLLTPAFGMQYLAWGVAAAYLVSLRGGWLFNVAASVFVLQVYGSWSGGGGPWVWEVAVAEPLHDGQLPLMALTWACLLVVWIDGLVPASWERRRNGTLGSGYTCVGPRIRGTTLDMDGDRRWATEAQSD
ncbi:glycosyltransferase 87 family protein [Nocardioides houyundeii]|uniref:glycosyltransferase 87 family protein n=1 Tax=Nocardioides houyundeii TaxID=2045452 RepID=UPI0013155006|nr:glycosyltransferase 87 family protein [Nocardioides houyundeii]